MNTQIIALLVLPFIGAIITFVAGKYKKTGGSMKTLEELRKIREKAQHDMKLQNSDYTYKIVVGMGTSGIAMGAREVMKAILDEIAQRDIRNVLVTQTGEKGLSSLEPVIDVIEPGKPVITYGNIDKIKAKVRRRQYVYSDHGDDERQDENLTLAQVEQALLNGEMLEQYPDTGRGESCLLVGFAENVPIHVVCGWRGDDLVIITVYIPRLPKFIDPRTRRGD